MEFDRWMHLAEREDVQTAARLHYGKRCGMQRLLEFPFYLVKKKTIEEEHIDF